MPFVTGRIPLTPTRRRRSLLAAVAATGILLAGCSSSSSSGSATAAAPSSSSPSTSAAPSSPTAVATGPAAGLQTRSNALGTYLADSKGRTVYLYTADPVDDVSACTGACATAWPPMTTVGAPTGSTGVTTSLIGTVTRADGSKQVTYARHLLYYFAKDSSVGATNGQGIGTKWWLVSPAGTPITKM